MGELVTGVLHFSRRGADQVSTVDVRPELARSVELIQHLLRKRRVTVVREFAPNTPVILADPQKLRQVFLNLLTNAADAMPAGGRLVLRVRVGELPGERPAVVV